MKKLTRAVPHLIFSFLAAVCLVAEGGVASASPIGPGNDFFATVSGAGGAEVDLSFLLPSVGTIDLEGAPIAGNGADTIVQRLQGIDPFEVCPTLPCSDTIDIELVALSLTSVSPVDLSDLGGPFLGVFADAYFTVNKGGIIPGLPQPDALNPSIGQMEITHDDILGGTFESCLGNPSDPAGVCSTLGVLGGGVYSNGIFTIVGGDPSNPLDVFFSAAGPRLAVSGINGIWEHDAGFDGGFKVISVEDTCNFPECHEPIVPVPEPSTALLMSIGLAALGSRRRWGRIG